MAMFNGCNTSEHGSLTQGSASGAGTVNGVGFIYDTIPMPVMRSNIQIKQVANTAKIDSIFTFDLNTNTTQNLFMISGKTYYVRAYAKKSAGGNDTVCRQIQDCQKKQKSG